VGRQVDADVIVAAEQAGVAQQRFVQPLVRVHVGGQAQELHLAAVAVLLPVRGQDAVDRIRAGGIDVEVAVDGAHEEEVVGAHPHVRKRAAHVAGRGQRQVSLERNRDVAEYRVIAGTAGEQLGRDAQARQPMALRGRRRGEGVARERVIEIERTGAGHENRTVLVERVTGGGGVAAGGVRIVAHDVRVGFHGAARVVDVQRRTVQRPTDGLTGIGQIAGRSGVLQQPAQRGVECGVLLCQRVLLVDDGLRQFDAGIGHIARPY